MNKDDFKKILAEMIKKLNKKKDAEKTQAAVYGDVVTAENTPDDESKAPTS